MTEVGAPPASPVSRSSNVASWPGSRSRTIVAHPAEIWHRRISERIQELVRLAPGWDGYAGRPVSFETGMFACNVLSAIWRWDTPIPQIVPGSAGDLQIEWHMSDTTVELHVLGPNRVSAWRCVVEGDPDGEDIDLTNDFAPIENWSERLTGPQLAVEASAM